MHHGAPIWHTERGKLDDALARCLLMATPPGLDEDERVAVDDGDDLGGPVACAPALVTWPTELMAGLQMRRMRFKAASSRAGITSSRRWLRRR